MRELQCPPKSKHEVDGAPEAEAAAEASQLFFDEQHRWFAAALDEFNNGANKRDRNQR